MNKSITHTGTVTKSGNGYITVNITPELSECGGCAISAMCKKTELVEVPYSGDGTALIGKKVVISASVGMQRGAVLCFFVIPILLLIGMLIMSLVAGASETSASLIAIGSVIIWYLVLYLLRNKLDRKTNFTLKSATTHI